jgi:endonuclease YncB( thermonuclease family)
MDLSLEKCGLDTPAFSLSGKECYCKLVDMYDADTLTLVVPLFDRYYKFSCRVYGIDTAEIKSGSEELKMKAQRAKNRMLQLCGVGQVELERVYSRKEVQGMLGEGVYLVWCKFMKFDKYGRPLVVVYDREQGMEVSGVLVAEKLANAYFGGTKEKF